ncbi:MAG: urease accessory protein UreD [Acetobacteraceae bacterium]|nr:urease accessory protein UreD [Acetobacteraceae bacterium]
MQRATGAIDAGFVRRGVRTVLSTLRQEGCLKARFPARPPAAHAAEIVTLNISGGVAAGDRLAVRIRAAEGAEVIVASQAAERFYRAMEASPPASVRATIEVAAGASLDWLPQETILFDGASVQRRLDVEIAADARFVGVEALVFGRAAMGEDVRRLHFRDLIRVGRNGEPVLHDAIRMEGDAHAALRRKAIGGGARAIGTIVHAAPDAETLLDPVRAALAGHQAETGASAWDGLLVVRIVAQDGACLRAAIVAGLAVLRDGRPLPRTWMC